jgi:hypothetical protein
MTTWKSGPRAEEIWPVEGAVILRMVQLLYDDNAEPGPEDEEAERRREERQELEALAASLPKRIRDRLKWLADEFNSAAMPSIPVNPDVSDDLLGAMVRASCQIHKLPEKGPVAIDFDDTLSCYLTGAPCWPGVALAHRCQRAGLPWSIVSARWERQQHRSEMLRFCLNHGLTPEDIILTKLQPKGCTLAERGFTMLFDDRDRELDSAREFGIEAAYVPKTFLPASSPSASPPAAEPGVTEEEK